MNSLDTLDTCRVAIFIDGSNLYHALEQSCGGSDLNFASFIKWLTQDRTLYRTYYYNILQEEKRRPADHREQQKFLEALNQVPYLETLATDMLHYAWQDYYDMAVLVSGDGDYAYALQTAKNIGKYVQVVAFESNQSQDLWKIADTTTLLTGEMLSKEKLWLNNDDKPKRKRRRPTSTSRSAVKQKKEPAKVSKK